MTGCGNLPASNWCKAARHRLDDWSNTWIALVHTDRAGGGAKYKYGEFDPWGKQSYFAQPYMYVLFNLTADPYELYNIYNETKASPAGAHFVAMLKGKLDSYKRCSGDSCRTAAGEIVYSE